MDEAKAQLFDVEHWVQQTLAIFESLQEREDAQASARYREAEQRDLDRADTRSLDALQRAARDRLNLDIPTEARVTDVLACLATRAATNPTAKMWHETLEKQWAVYSEAVLHNLPVEFLREEEAMRGPKALQRLLRRVTFDEAFHNGHDGAPAALRTALRSLTHELRARVPLLGKPYATASEAPSKRTRHAPARQWDEGGVRRAVLSYWAQGTDLGTGLWYAARIRPAAMRLAEDARALARLVNNTTLRGDSHAFEPFASTAARRERLYAAVRAFHVRVQDIFPRHKTWASLDRELQVLLHDVRAAREDATAKWDALNAETECVRRWAEFSESRALMTTLVRSLNDYQARLEAEPLSLHTAPKTIHAITSLVATALDVFRECEAAVPLPAAPTVERDGAEWVRTVAELVGNVPDAQLARVRTWRAQLYLSAMQADQLRVREARVLQFMRAAAGTPPASWPGAWAALADTQDEADTTQLEAAVALDAAARVCVPFDELRNATDGALTQIACLLEDDEFPAILPAAVSQRAPVLPGPFAGANPGAHAHAFLEQCLDVVDCAWPHTAQSPDLLDILHRLSAETTAAGTLTECVALVRTVATAAYLAMRVASTADA